MSGRPLFLPEQEWKLCWSHDTTKVEHSHVVVPVCSLEPEQGDLGDRFGRGAALMEAEKQHCLYYRAWRRSSCSHNYCAKEDAMLRKHALNLCMLVCVCIPNSMCGDQRSK